ncbi:MAG: AAA family ATPase [Gemmatimonadetes bacterium]|nr:AAA family ATPase [Gemmatimonadota bacterium]
MNQLLTVSLKDSEYPEAFPFTVPAVRSLGSLDLEATVNLFVGENGSGKSTLLEGLAVACDLPAVGSGSLAVDPSLEAQRRLGKALRLVWRGRNHRGFFLRAEDFFGFQKRVAADRVEHEAELGRLDAELISASPLARNLAMGVHRGSIQALESRYGQNPDARSHGEAFLDLFKARLVPEGLFLMDEPEAALSAQSQLAFISMIHDAVGAGGQFVIATHSPILMAIPGARIFSFDGGLIRRELFDDLDAVTLVRDFLQAPGRFLRHLWPSLEGSSE